MRVRGVSIRGYTIGAARRRIDRNAPATDSQRRRPMVAPAHRLRGAHMAVIQHSSTELRTLRALSRGEVVSPADTSYDEARAAWNLAADQRPAAVVFPENESDVAFAMA